MSLHTDDILDAIVAAVKADPPDGGVASYPETFPIGWVEETHLPALLLGLDRVEIALSEESLKGQEQHYYFDLIYVMENEDEAHPRKAARQQAEQIVDALEADRTLGVTAFEIGDSGVGMLQSDNAVQTAFLDNGVPRTAVWIKFEAQVSD